MQVKSKEALIWQTTETIQNFDAVVSDFAAKLSEAQQQGRLESCCIESSSSCGRCAVFIGYEEGDNPIEAQDLLREVVRDKLGVWVRHNADGHWFPWVGEPYSLSYAEACIMQESEILNLAHQPKALDSRCPVVETLLHAVDLFEKSNGMRFDKFREIALFSFCRGMNYNVK